VQPATHQKEIVDFDTALTQVPGGVKVLKDLARIFLMECPKLLKDFRQGLADENVELTQRAAHTLKGAARILAANRLAALAGELEKLAKDKQLDTVRSRLGEIEAAVIRPAEIIRGLARLIRRINSRHWLARFETPCRSGGC